MLRHALLSVITASVAALHGAAWGTTAEELYESCIAFQVSRSKTLAQKLNAEDAFRAGQCAGFAQAFPSGYMFGSAMATQTANAKGNAMPPQCYQPGITQVGEVATAVVRRYEKGRSELRGQPAEVLLLLALRDELPCTRR